MKVLVDARIAAKVAAPLLIFALVTAGLIVYARGAVTTLAQQTQRLVDVEAQRFENILAVRINVVEATVQNRNIII